MKKGIQFCLMVCGASGTGTFTRPRHPLSCSINNAIPRLTGPRAQAGLPSSTPFADSLFSTTRTAMTRTLPMSRRASRSSP